MPFYNYINNWNGLEIQASPISRWRKRFPFWPYFVGEKIQFELKVNKLGGYEANDIKFHLVEKMSEEEKPRILMPRLLATESNDKIKIYNLENPPRVISKGEVRFWPSNRGYIVESEPVFAADVIYMDTLVIPSLLVLVGPFLGFLIGLVLGLLVGG